MTPPKLKTIPLIKHIVFVLFLSIGVLWNTVAQHKKGSIVEAELMGGRVVPNYSVNFPTSTLQSAIAISFARENTDTTGWGKYYQYPESGITFFASHLGNNKVYGNQFSLSPYIAFKLNQKEKPFHIKLSIGLSYFTTSFDSSDNLDNVAIGSALTWGFQAFLYKTIFKGSYTTYKIGGGYSHASNGHTQLPNFGLNSALLSLSAQFHSAKNETKKEIIPRVNRKQKKHYFIQYRGGVGFHELGGTAEPIGGVKREVYTTSLAGGVIFNNHLKIRAGFAYRYYEQYYNYIMVHQHPDYINNPNQSASNLYFFVGSEFLMSHISLDIAGGLNLYKPFYKEFNAEYEKNTGFRYQLKKWLNSRMGINVYLANTNLAPIHNIFAGAHINANFGQADFTEFNLGYVYLIK